MPTIPSLSVVTRAIVAEAVLAEGFREQGPIVSPAERAEVIRLSRQSAPAVGRGAPAPSPPPSVLPSALPFLPDPTKRAHICHECDEWSPVSESKPTGKGVCDLIQAKQDALRQAGKPCGCPGHLTRMAQAGSASCPDGKF